MDIHRFLVLIKIYLAVLQIYFRVWLSQTPKKRKIRLPRIRVKVRSILPPDNRFCSPSRGLNTALREALREVLRAPRLVLSPFTWGSLGDRASLRSFLATGQTH